VIDGGEVPAPVPDEAVGDQVEGAGEPAAIVDVEDDGAAHGVGRVDGREHARTGSPLGPGPPKKLPTIRPCRRCDGPGRRAERGVDCGEDPVGEQEPVR
jgi:hypothetical protein